MGAQLPRSSRYSKGFPNARLFGDSNLLQAHEEGEAIQPLLSPLWLGDALPEHGVYGRGGQHSLEIRVLSVEQEDV